MTGLPTWVADAIETRTGIDPRGVARRAQAGVCVRCGARVLRGLDDDRCALPAEVDPARLTTIGELTALLTGRWTYQLDGHPPVLTHRGRSRIRWRPADQATVLPEHKCGTPPLPAFPDSPPPLKAGRKADAANPEF